MLRKTITSTCKQFTTKPLKCRAVTSSYHSSNLLLQQQQQATAEKAAKKEKRRDNIVFSGIQPSGTIHIGNYLGAIKNWKEMQDKPEFSQRLFCLVDLHAITLPYEPQKLQSNTIEMQASLLGCGLDPSKCIMYMQSHVTGHAELSWLLGCLTPVGWLNRMVAFKEKKEKTGEATASTGLYTYPVLQAADILLYASKYRVTVPVGDDQRQHLELASDIAKAFNFRVKQSFFSIPNPVFPPVARVMSLRDGTKKMSKSDESDFSRITITDSADQIRSKIKKAKTDSLEGISYDREQRPEVTNLVDMYASFEGLSATEVVQKFQNERTSVFKEALAEVLVKHICPIGSEVNRLLQKENREYVKKIFEEGAQKAREIADPTLREAKQLLGFYLPPSKQ